MSAVGSRLRRLGDTIVAFRCPGCDVMHQVWTDRWHWNGDGDAPTFSPSVLVQWDEGEERTPKRCHSFVRNGEIQFLGDCTHELVGQTVELPAINEEDQS